MKPFKWEWRGFTLSYGKPDPKPSLHSVTLPSGLLLDTEASWIDEEVSTKPSSLKALGSMGSTIHGLAASTYPQWATLTATNQLQSMSVTQQQLNSMLQSMYGMQDYQSQFSLLSTQQQSFVSQHSLTSLPETSSDSCWLSVEI